MYITWDDAVQEGIRLIASVDAGQMRLGEIADRLEPKYGDSFGALRTSHRNEHQYATKLQISLP
jgi:hypothetical protein